MRPPLVFSDILCMKFEKRLDEELVATITLKTIDANGRHDSALHFVASSLKGIKGQHGMPIFQAS